MTALCAMFAAVEFAGRFKPVSYDTNAAMPAHRSQSMNRTFEAVIRVGFTTHGNLECLIVVISAGFTLRHTHSPNPDIDVQSISADRNPFHMTRRKVLPPQAGLNAPDAHGDASMQSSDAIPDPGYGWKYSRLSLRSSNRCSLLR